MCCQYERVIVGVGESDGSSCHYERVMIICQYMTVMVRIV